MLVDVNIIGATAFLRDGSVLLMVVPAARVRPRLAREVRGQFHCEIGTDGVLHLGERVRRMLPTRVNPAAIAATQTALQS